MTETLAIGGALVTVDAQPAPQLPLEPAAPAPPTPCQIKGHAWQRLAAELNLDGPSTRPRNFRCTRLGCAARRRDDWQDGRWVSRVNPPPLPDKEKADEKPATDFEKGAAAADNMRGRDETKPADWLSGYDDQKRRMKKPWGVTPPADATDLQHPGEVDPAVQAVRDRTRGLSKGEP